MRASGRPICAAPLEGIPSTVPLHDALFLYGEAVQSNHRFWHTVICLLPSIWLNIRRHK